MKTTVLILSILCQISYQIRPQQLRISQSNPNSQLSDNFSKNENSNYFEIQIVDEEMLEGKKLFLVFESTNPNFIVSILDEKTTHSNKKAIIMDMNSYNGNIAMVMSDSFFNSKLDFFKNTGFLRLKIRQSTQEEEGYSKDYTIKVFISDIMTLDFGKDYTTRIDYNINSLQVNLPYDGSKKEKLQKLRFQLTTVKQYSKFSMSAQLRYLTQTFIMNNIFKGSVGGMLTAPQLPVCKAGNCEYMMDIKLKGVKVVNIESNFIEGLDLLSINHFGGYYDKTYKANIISYYKLPYIKAMEGLNVSISLIPVTGESALYVNPTSKPLTLDKYAWKETGHIAKRITIYWDELIQMKANGQDLYIAVDTKKAGEFSLTLDAHDNNFRGTLSSGITEAGFVKFDQMNKYLHSFNVLETQQISFEVNLNIISGDLDLYMKSCEKLADCFTQLEDITKQKDILKVENTQSNKQLKHKFECKKKKKHALTTCHFLVIVKGKENHGTHFELSLHENNYHRLMLPGHQVSLNLVTQEKVFLKFSYPHKSHNKKLYFQIENVWGDFDVYLSKEAQFPDDQNNLKKLSFDSSNAGLLDSLSTKEMNEEFLDKKMVQGIYFLTVEARSSCSLNLKFFEKSVETIEDKKEQNQISIHTLTAGQQVRGEINKSNEIIYYTIRACLDSKKTTNTIVNLTSLKGDFLIYANGSDQLPTKENHQYFSADGSLKLLMKCDGLKVEEYLIGIQPADNIEIEAEKLQFIISFVYSGKALKLTPGILSTHFIKDNLFYVELHKDMKNVLIIKTIVDGYNIDLCGSFGKQTEIQSNEQCEFAAKSKNVSIYLNQKTLSDKCEKFKSKCFFHLQIKNGSMNEKFTIGYTYNDLPFHISKGTLFTGPSPLGTKGVVNFVYHPSTAKPCNLYFNSQGTNAVMYSKIVKASEFSKGKVQYPNRSNTNSNSLVEKSTEYVRNQIYTSSQMKLLGSNPEILISIRNQLEQNGYPEQFFDPFHAFLLQIHTDSKEILRTHSFSEQIPANEWNYYHFYNNGNSNSLRVYVNSTGQEHLEVQLSKGLQSRPPFTNKALIAQKALSNVILNLVPDDIEQDKHFKKNTLRGSFVVAVKSNSATKISIFWNNKADLNFLELTPNRPATMTLEANRTFYFTFYSKASSNKKKGNVVVYIKTTVPCEIYMLKSETNDMDAPSSTNFSWKSTTGALEHGGLTAIEIGPLDAEYCENCQYIGSVISKKKGQVNILADIEQSGIPITLSINNPFPCFLEPHQSKFYAIENPDSDLIDVTINLLQGYVDVFVSDTRDVSDTKFKERYQLKKNLESHKFFVIAPSVKYNIHKKHTFYIMIKNTTDKPASLYITLDKNDIKQNIEPGIDKFFRLAPGETKDFYYKPASDENLFNVQFELLQVFQSKFKPQALSLIQDYIQVFNVSQFGDRYMLKYDEKSANYNQVYLNFDITQNTQGTFIVHIYNPVGSGVEVRVSLISGGYKLLHLNQHSLEKVKSKQTKFYEAYGFNQKFLFFDLKMCYGDVSVSFFETDLQNQDSANSSKYKTIKDSNSFLHYLKIKNKRVFLKLENQSENDAYFDMSAYMEKDLQSSPYSEIIQLNDGQVRFESDTNRVAFTALKIVSHYEENFFHSINYRVYLSTNFEAMRYAKHCGAFMSQQVFPDDFIHQFSLSLDIKQEDIAQHQGTFTIQIDHLPKGKKFYGVLVAEIMIFPKDLGYLTPIRSNKIFYDEFIFTSAKYDIPTIYYLMILLCLGGFGMLYFIIKGYIFGKINRMKGLEQLSDFKNFDESGTGFAVMKALESDFFREMQEEEEKQKKKQEDEMEEIEVELEVEDDIEQKVKEEMEMQEIEMVEKEDDQK